MSGTNRGGQPGNDNARVGSIVRGAIRRVFAENEAKGRDSLVNIVRNLVDKAELEGDLSSTRELFDRLDGKASQALAVSGDGEGGPIIQRIERTIVRANPQSSNG